MVKFVDTFCCVVIGIHFVLMVAVEFHILRKQFEIWEDLRQSRKIMESWDVRAAE